MRGEGRHLARCLSDCWKELIDIDVDCGGVANIIITLIIDILYHRGSIGLPVCPSIESSPTCSYLLDTDLNQR